MLPQKEYPFKFYKAHLYLTGLSFRRILAVFAMWERNLFPFKPSISLVSFVIVLNHMCKLDKRFILFLEGFKQCDIISSAFLSKQGIMPI